MIRPHLDLPRIMQVTGKGMGRAALEGDVAPTAWVQGSQGTEGLFVGAAMARGGEVTTNDS